MTAKVAKPSVAIDAPAAIVSKMIVSIKGRGVKLDSDVHSTALACLHHADKHGDITLMNSLLMALPKSARRNALAQWAVKFGKFSESTIKETKATAPLMFNKGGKTDLPAATAMPFWEFKNVAEGTKDWVFGDYKARIIKTLSQHADDPEANAMLALLQGVAPGVTMQEVQPAVAVH